MEYKFTTYKIADISTCHITEKDGQLLEKKRCPLRLAETDSKSGTILWVPQDAETWLDEQRTLIELGFSEAFLNIMQALHEQKIEYVRFDADSDVDDEWPTFDW
jgi:hypothetical protein